MRPATIEEIPQLEAAIAADEESIPFHKTITYVAEHNGKLTHFASARLVWLVEPLKELPAAAELEPHARRRAVLQLANAIEGWIGDRTRNRSGVYTYFAHVLNRKFQQLCEAYGLRRWYPRCRLYGKEL